MLVFMQVQNRVGRLDDVDLLLNSEFSMASCLPSIENSSGEI